MVVFSTFNHQTLVSKGQHRDINHNSTRKIVSIDIMRYMSIDRAHVDTMMWLIVDILQKSSRIWQATCFFRRGEVFVIHQTLWFLLLYKTRSKPWFFYLKEHARMEHPNPCVATQVVERSPENSSINGVNVCMSKH